MSDITIANFDPVAETPFLRRVHVARLQGRCYYCDHALADCRCDEEFAARGPQPIQPLYDLIGEPLPAKQEVAAA